MSGDAKLEVLKGSTAVESKSTYEASWRQWQAIIAGGGVGKGETPATCIAKAAYGEAYGWPAILAVNRIYLVEGRPCLAAEAMAGLVRERVPQATIEKVEHTDQICVVRAKRRPEDAWHTVEFTWADAERAGLTKKTNWRSYPKQMLWARTISMLTRELFSDITLGAHTPDEASPVPMGTVRQATRERATLFDEPVDEPEPEDTDFEEKPAAPVEPHIELDPQPQAPTDEWDPRDVDAP